MHLQEVTQELAAVLIKYRCEQYQPIDTYSVKNNKKRTRYIRLSPESINQQEEIAKKLLLCVIKVNVYINHINSLSLLKGYQYALLSMLHEARTRLHGLEIEDGVTLDLLKIFNNYTQKFKKVRHELYSDVSNKRFTSILVNNGRILRSNKVKHM